MEGREGPERGLGRFEGDIENEPFAPIAIAGQVKIKQAHDWEDASKLLISLYDKKILNPDNYLLASGFAAEIITEITRPHHDLDLIVFDRETAFELRDSGYDAVTPGDNWARLDLNEEFLRATRSTIEREINGRKFLIPVINPAILIVQKCTAAFDREPRDKDIQDSRNLIRWILSQPNNLRQRYSGIMEQTIAAVPEKYANDTTRRVSEITKYVRLELSP